MIFEWDDKKNKSNLIKHGIDFETAALVFNDRNRIEYYDADHSMFEDRYITIGMINDVVIVIVVVYTERTESLRIISARKATRQERNVYYGNT